jgi:GMP reductase
MICADGGCTVPGDICKSLCAGADFIMLGGMLAGHTESGGELISKTFETKLAEVQKDGSYSCVLEKKLFKQFYGMSSKYAQELFYGGMKKYRASEGKVVEIPFRGPIENTLLDILGGIRSAMTYIGAKRIKDMPKCATFYRVNRQLNNIFGQE